MKEASTHKACPSADNSDDYQGIQDLTQLLQPHPKRTERRRRKLEKRAAIPRPGPRGFLGLPFELSMAILSLLRPYDIFALSRANRKHHAFILAE